MAVAADRPCAADPGSAGSRRIRAGLTGARNLRISALAPPVICGWGDTMHWSSVVIALYAAGFLEFWRLCADAPIAEDEPG